MASEIETKVCVMCGNTIDPTSLAFEQRLIGDEDFCRKCWNIIMEGYQEEEIPLPILITTTTTSGVAINAGHG